MTEDDIKKVVSDVLLMRFPDGQYTGADVRFDDDFDGVPIIRVTAHYDTRPDSRAELVRTVHAIRDKLIEAGEERYVFLTNDILSERQAQADVD